MLLQFDLIPPRVKGRLFESRGERRMPCRRSRKGLKPKQETERDKRLSRGHRTRPSAGIFTGIKSGTPPSWLRDTLCQ
jgi:hypothetical protein